MKHVEDLTHQISTVRWPFSTTLVATYYWISVSPTELREPYFQVAVARASLQVPLFAQGLI